MKKLFILSIALLLLGSFLVEAQTYKGSLFEVGAHVHRWNEYKGQALVFTSKGVRSKPVFIRHVVRVDGYINTGKKTSYNGVSYDFLCKPERFDGLTFRESRVVRDCILQRSYPKV